jgi:hypothetical protein
VGDSVHRDVTEAIKTALAAMTVAGGYHYNYNAADQVQIGLASTAPKPNAPAIFISLEESASSYGPELTRFTRAARYVIEAVIPSNENPGSQQLDAMDAMDDVMRALEANRSLGLRSSGVRDLILEGRAFAGAWIAFGCYGVASITATVTINLATGA